MARGAVDSSPGTVMLLIPKHSPIVEAILHVLVVPGLAVAAMVAIGMM